MNEDRMADPTSGEQPEEQDQTPAPSGLFWPFKRAWWAIEKHLLWPIADSFRRMAEGPALSQSARLHRSHGAGLPDRRCRGDSGLLLQRGRPFRSWSGGRRSPARCRYRRRAGPAAPAASAPAAEERSDDETLQGVVPDFDGPPATPVATDPVARATPAARAKERSCRRPWFVRLTFRSRPRSGWLTASPIRSSATRSARRRRPGPSVEPPPASWPGSWPPVRRGCRPTGGAEGICPQRGLRQEEGPSDGSERLPDALRCDQRTPARADPSEREGLARQ